MISAFPNIDDHDGPKAEKQRVELLQQHITAVSTIDSLLETMKPQVSNHGTFPRDNGATPNEPNPVERYAEIHKAWFPVNSQSTAIHLGDTSTSVRSGAVRNTRRFEAGNVALIALVAGAAGLLLVGQSIFFNGEPNSPAEQTPPTTAATLLLDTPIAPVEFS